MTKTRPTPCEACPYRRDVAPGVWAPHEYEKLRGYDLPTGAQPMAEFACHASPQALCHGWVVVHQNRGHENELLALRIWPLDGPVPSEVVPLFSSGNEAADHGQQEMNADSLVTIGRLVRKHSRLRDD